MTVRQIDNEISKRREQIAKLEAAQTTKREDIEALEAKRGALRTAALRGCDPNAQSELAATRHAISVSTLELEDIGAELATVGTEIEELVKEKQTAFRHECRAKFEVESAAAVKEAATIEKHLDAFLTAIRPHLEHLARLNSLMQQGQLNGKRFSSDELRRHVEEVYRTRCEPILGGQVAKFFPKAATEHYQQNYGDIFKSKVSAITRSEGVSAHAA
jgi:hypothetical protein